MYRFLLSDDFYVLKLSFYTIGFTGSVLVAVPFSFLTLIVVSLLTQKENQAAA